MKIAGIDIGSNTSLLLIVEQNKEGCEVLVDHIYFTRLAENIEKNQEISEGAFHRLDRAFSSMRKLLDENQVDVCSVVATSAARQAKNKDRLMALSKKYNLSPLQIISPKREAELTFIGTFFGLGHEPSRPLVIDIGGGSTEFVNSQKSYSLNIGSVSLTERFLSASPLSLVDKKSLNQFIQYQLQSVDEFLKENHDLLIFTAGTPTTLAFIEKQTSDFNKVHGLLLKTELVYSWLKKLSALSVEERKQIPHLPEHRADVIVAGLSLLYEILQKSGKEEFAVSATGVRYGLVLEEFPK